MDKVVVKVGGSLLEWDGFPHRLRDFLQRQGRRRVVLVVGGGPAADFVRALDSRHAIGENRSHALALRALDLTAHLVAALVPGLDVVEQPETLGEVWSRGRIPILVPRWFMDEVDRRSDDPLPETWQVTSDSIAARLAVSLGIEDLVLLKSTDVARGVTRAEAATAGVVDPIFPRASEGIARVSVINFRDDLNRAEPLK